jgi:hypothetical protein
MVVFHQMNTVFKKSKKAASGGVFRRMLTMMQTILMGWKKKDSRPKLTMGPLMKLGHILNMTIS